MIFGRNIDAIESKILREFRPHTMKLIKTAVSLAKLFIFVWIGNTKLPDAFFSW